MLTQHNMPQHNITRYITL